MLRTLWFAVKVGLMVAAAVWVASRPGTVTLTWMDYTVEAKAWFALLGVFCFLLALLGLYRLFLSVMGFTGAMGRYRDYRRQAKGQRAILLGLDAAAAGDAKIAYYQASRARKFMPRDRGLTLLLEADAARLKGDHPGALKAYARLLDNKDTAFLGMRGLLSSAIGQGQTPEALELARKAQAMHPKQPWIAKLVYRLEVQAREWDAALRSLRRLEKSRSLDADSVMRDRQALLLQQARENFDNARNGPGLEKLKQAYRLDPAFAPAALWLAEHYIETGQRRAAVKIVSRSWAAQPHPELAALWTRLSPYNKPGDVSVRLRWFEKLVALRPDSAESQLVAAHAAIEDRLWGEARQYLRMAESMQQAPSARLYRLRAEMEEQLSHPAEARHWQDKAAQAAPDRVWTCRETGRIYDRWSPVAEPHGAFNTIVWDYPSPRGMLSSPENDNAVMLPALSFLVQGS